MSFQTEISDIRRIVENMSERGNTNAENQATIKEKVSNIEKKLDEIKPLLHAPNSCQTVTMLQEQVKEIPLLRKEVKGMKPRQMSMKKELGIIGAITTGMVALAETIIRLFKP